MIHVILTCTSSKTYHPNNELLFRNIVGSTQQHLFNQWVDNISHAPKYTAIDVYGGQLKKFYHEMGEGVTLWIASAGLGLITPISLIPSYNITFNHRWEDGVRRNFKPKIAEQNWWEMLCQYNNLSIAGLTKQFPDDTFIFSTSEAYYPALINDICTASQYTSNAVFISRWLGGVFNGIIMPTDKRIIPLIGATEYNMASMYALYCINQIKLGASWLDISANVTQYINDTPKVIRKSIPRLKISDWDIIRYINDNNTLTIPQIINKIRDDGYSCGADRFNKIARKIDLIK